MKKTFNPSDFQIFLCSSHSELALQTKKITFDRSKSNVRFYEGKYITWFYDRITVHRNRFLLCKTNRCTEFQFYWYYDSTCFGQPFCPSSGVLSRTSALVYFMQFHPTPGSKRPSQLHKMYQSRCKAKNSWWWAERLPETCRVIIPIKLEFGASVGFIHMT